MPVPDSLAIPALVLESLSEGVCLCDIEGQIVWSNTAFKQLDPTATSNIAAACRQAARSFLDPAVVGGGAGAAPRTRYDIGTQDEARWFEASISPVRGPSGAKLAHVAAVINDVSAARRIQSKMDAIDRAGTELVRLDADTIRKMNTAERLRVLEQKIIKFAHDLLHFDHFAIRLVDEKTSKLELVMSCGLPQEAMEVELYARREGNGISGFVAATGRSYICTDAATDPRYVLGIVAARSSITIPLRMSDKVIGVFNIESTQLGAFNEEDRQFGEMFATYIALALHILDLLVVERSTTGKAVTGTVEGELSEPLEDIAVVSARLKTALAAIAPVPGAPNTAPVPVLDPSISRFVERIIADVDSIKRRMKDVAAGPATILGAEKSIAEAALDPALVGRHVLVADDDQRIRQIIRDVLRGRGAEVTVCENGTQAIEAIARMVAGKGSASSAVGSSAPGQERQIEATPGIGQPGKFDLIVSDIKMPDQTGYEIFAAARKVMAGIPVILMTGFGYDPHHSIVRASQEGLSCVLFKPFQAERLIEEVHKALLKK
jgi:two-component system, sensor histidine kinase SagS